jgi:hypothetical protein
MKYLFIGLLAIAAMQMTACKETDSLKNDVTNEKMKDTLNKLYPSLRQGQIGIQVKDFQDVSITLGDQQLFAKTNEELTAMSATVGELVYQLYHENNYLSEGKLIIVEVENKMPTDADPKKEFDLHLKDVVKAHEK